MRTVRGRLVPNSRESSKSLSTLMKSPFLSDIHRLKLDHVDTDRGGARVSTCMQYFLHSLCPSRADMAYSRMHLEIKRVEGARGAEQDRVVCPPPLHSSVKLGIPQFLCACMNLIPRLLKGGLTSSLCIFGPSRGWSCMALCPVCLGDPCTLVHNQNRSYIAQHALVAMWSFVSDIDFSSPPSQSCSPSNQCLAGDSARSLSSG